MADSLYDVLGVDAWADPATIKAAYLAAAKRCHPDRGGSDEEFLAVQAAWEVLGDPIRKSRYDATGDETGKVRSPDEWEALVLTEVSRVIVRLIDSPTDIANGNIMALIERNLDATRSSIMVEIGRHEVQIRRVDSLERRFRRRRAAPEAMGDALKAIFDMQRANPISALALARDALELHNRVEDFFGAFENATDEEMAALFNRAAEITAR